RIPFLLYTVVALIQGTSLAGPSLETADLFKKMFSTEQPYVSPATLSHFTIGPKDRKSMVASFCDKLEGSFRRYKWPQPACHGVNWQVKYHTAGKYPLIYAVYGKGEQTTLILGGVHPDEITPVAI